MPLDTPADLRSHVTLALQVELSTIPLYLFAHYTIEDPVSEAARLVKSVAAEEMLHLALCSNLLLSIGGQPDFLNPDIIPRYPSLMEHHKPDLRLDLAPCSIDLIRDVFMVIERPELHDAPPEPDQYETLGQFYHALEIAIEDLAERHDLFAQPQRVRQMGDPSFYAPVTCDVADSGGLLLIEDVDSARAAIEVIVHQGEGLSDDRWADPAHQELTHYQKYKAIAEGEVPLSHVSPAPTNPRTADYPDAIRPVSDLFNALYRTVFFTLHEIFSGDPDKGPGIGRLYRTMSNLMAPVARYLLQQPLGDGKVAAPTFEVFEFTTDDPSLETRSLAERVAEKHPDLAGIASLLAES